MDGKEIIPTNTEEFSGVIVERSNRRTKKRYFLKLFVVMLVTLAVILVYKYHIEIYEFLMGFNMQIHTPNTENSYTPPGNLVDDNKNDNQAPPPQTAIPEGAYVVYEETVLEHTIINESACDLEPSLQATFSSLDEIYNEFGKDAPVVLITHFSSRECYSNGKYYFTTDSFYSDEQNVGQLGALLCEKFNDIGINAIHLNEVYASGAVFSSQKEYNDALCGTLEKFPSISFVINLTRDVSVKKDLSLNKYVTYIENQPCAQLCIISGTSYDTLTEAQERNIGVALGLGKHINQTYNGLVMSNTISRFALSQNYEPICFELELGGYGNSFEEASCSLDYFSSAFYDFLTKE